MTGPTSNGSIGKGMSVVVVEDAAGLTDHVPAWEALAAAAIEPNVFYEPWMLLPALRMFGSGERFRFVFVYWSDPGRPGGTPVLCGFFPLCVTRHSHLRASLLRLWSHDYCYLCTPLLRAGQAREALNTFADWLATDPRGCALMEYRKVVGEGPFHHLLVDHLLERGALSSVTRCHTRAFFRRGADAETYLRGALSGDRRRNLKRGEKRLSEIGPIEYRLFGPGDDIESWAEAFLRLEAAGWKGREKSALDCDATSREFFLTVAREAASRGALLMHALHLDGRPVAMRCSFVTGEGSFFFKPAFDEEYAKCSPGVLVELETIRWLHANPQVRWMDSCTSPDNDLMNLVWTDRRVFQTTLVATHQQLGGLTVSMIPLMRWLKRNVAHARPRRAWAKVAAVAMALSRRMSA
jgi:CelD/BcsL family acetyltransferase involved in cellulose biosynthesis